MCVEHRNFKKVIAYQDSIIVAEKESLSLLGLQLESCMVENKILDLDSDQKSKVINSCYEDNTVLKTDKEKLERKLKRLKRQRWIFGGVGFVGGIALFLLI